MKNINENEKVNRADHVIQARYLIVSLILIFIVSTITAFADSDKKTETQSTWKEIKLVLDADEYVWCGDRHIVFGNYGKYKGKGIRLYDLDSGVIENVTSDPEHGNASCTADGRYIVFTNKPFMEKQGILFVYDRNTKTIKKMYEMEKMLLNNIHSVILSPNANYLLGPDLPQGQKYILPGGKEVKLVPYRIGAGINEVQWSVDEKKLFVLNVRSENLAIYDVEKDKLTTSFIIVDGSSNPVDMRITKDSKLYVTALFGSEMDDDGFYNLYLFNLENLHEQPVLVVSNINYFDADDEGNIVYSKNIKDIKGVRYLEKGLYYLERGKNKTQLLKKFNVIRNAVKHPKISRNGNGIIFYIWSPEPYDKPKEFTILIKE